MKSYYKRITIDKFSKPAILLVSVLILTSTALMANSNLENLDSDKDKLSTINTKGINNYPFQQLSIDFEKEDTTVFVNTKYLKEIAITHKDDSLLISYKNDVFSAATIKDFVLYLTQKYPFITNAVTYRLLDNSTLELKLLVKLNNLEFNDYLNEFRKEIDNYIDQLNTAEITLPTATPSIDSTPSSIKKQKKHQLSFSFSPYNIKEINHYNMEVKSYIKYSFSLLVNYRYKLNKFLYLGIDLGYYGYFENSYASATYNSEIPLCAIFGVYTTVGKSFELFFDIGVGASLVKRNTAVGVFLIATAELGLNYSFNDTVAILAKTKLNFSTQNNPKDSSLNSITLVYSPIQLGLSINL